VSSLAGKRFVIVGLTRLTVRVSRLIADRSGEVTIVTGDGGAPDGGAGGGLTGRLPKGVRVIESHDMEAALDEAAVGGSSCLLALADDDLANLAAAVACHAFHPEVPIILRIYDITLADQLEHGLNIRRAYSVSTLAAPAFLAAGLGSQVLETLRLGETQVPIWEMVVPDGSPEVGRPAGDAEPSAGVQILGLREPAAPDATPSTDGWQAPVARSTPIAGGAGVVAGGPQERVVSFALGGRHLFAAANAKRETARARRRRRAAARASSRAARRDSGIGGATLLPVTAVVLAVFVIVSVIVFGVALHKGPVDAVYFAISTALGNETLDQSDAWLQIVGVIAMLAGGALLGVLFSYFASVATAVRIEQRMGRQAQRMSGHAVVAGLGTIGYRVGQLLHDSGIPWTAIDRAPDDRHAEAVGATAPVLTGDVRLPENLERAGIVDAACLFACTDSDLANIEACLQAKRLNPSIRTVARIFDDALAARVAGIFGVDAAVSATAVAAAAFVGAAADERALRPFQVGTVEHVALRWDVTDRVEPDRLRALRDAGVLVLARRRPDGSIEPSDEDRPIERGTEVIVAGPRAAVDASILRG
jgi:Trk K+ transport system NAD-binding subunit